MYGLLCLLSLSNESKKTPNPFQLSDEPNTSPLYSPFCDVYHSAKPSAPIRPRPETRKTISISQLSKFVGNFVQMAPFWLRSDGATLTLSELAMASVLIRMEEDEKLKKKIKIEISTTTDGQESSNVSQKKIYSKV